MWNGFRHDGNIEILLYGKCRSDMPMLSIRVLRHARLLDYSLSWNPNIFFHMIWQLHGFTTSGSSACWSVRYPGSRLTWYPGSRWSSKKYKMRIIIVSYTTWKIWLDRFSPKGDRSRGVMIHLKEIRVALTVGGGVSRWVLKILSLIMPPDVKYVGDSPIGSCQAAPIHAILAFTVQISHFLLCCCCHSAWKPEW